MTGPGMSQIHPYSMNGGLVPMSAGAVGGIDTKHAGGAHGSHGVQGAHGGGHQGSHSAQATNAKAGSLT
jgi:hypothetical protein